MTYRPDWKSLELDCGEGRTMVVEPADVVVFDAIARVFDTETCRRTTIRVDEDEMKSHLHKHNAIELDSAA